MRLLYLFVGVIVGTAVLGGLDWQIRSMLAMFVLGDDKDEVTVASQFVHEPSTVPSDAFIGYKYNSSSRACLELNSPAWIRGTETWRHPKWISDLPPT